MGLADDQQRCQPASILDFWFGKLENGFPVEDRSAFWFMGGDEVDKVIRERFSLCVQAARQGSQAHWNTTAEGRLANIILLDQFTRSIYRQTSEAFSGDEKALELSSKGVALGYDQALAFSQRVFFYMPFMHSETLKEHKRVEALLTELLKQVPVENQPSIKRTLAFAKEHQEIIEQFGRYPYRNQVLGRKSTAEELEYLKTATRYGQ